MQPQRSSLELTAAAARAADERAIHDWGIPSIALMESAGRACAEEAEILLAAQPPAASKSHEVVVLCGPGNNGGDGLVIARTLSNRGRRARVVAVGGPGALEGAGGDVGLNLRLWRGLGLGLEEFTPQDQPETLHAQLDGATLVVDALFGTGLSRPLGGVFATAVQSLEESGLPVLAVDLPSGLAADTGEVLGCAVRAHTTVTFVAPKPGFRRGAGPEHVGRVVVAEIGIPVEFARRAAAEFPAPTDTPSVD